MGDRRASIYPVKRLGGYIVKTVTPQPFRYVEDSSEQFFALFPHRYDYLFAEHPQPGQSPQWQTERRHPLSDRVLQQGAYLYGVRFGSQTSYCVLDIDRGSVYHPKHDSLAIARLLDALETIDLTEPLICTSSYSGGLHLYFPLAESANSWTLAIALSTILSNAGFEIRSGQLEILPNPKPYNPAAPSLFQGHRLPLQAGSYLLNRDLEPVCTGRSHFVKQWHLAQQHNTLSSSQLDQVLRQSLRRRYQVSNKAAKFLNDLNAEIELGWTGHGQTNRLLGRIALRTYVFHHVLTGFDPLEGQALVDEIVAVARSLPGYRDWCRHQHEIEKRAAEWARCVEQSHYFRYGGSKLSTLQIKSDASSGSGSLYGNRWNRQQAQSTRDRIQYLVQQLQTLCQWPQQITQRFRLLVQSGIGGGSLYRHKDLWHPSCISSDVKAKRSPEKISDITDSGSYKGDNQIESGSWAGMTNPLPQIKPSQIEPSLLSQTANSIAAEGDCLYVYSGSSLLSDDPSTLLSSQIYEHPLYESLPIQTSTQKFLDRATHYTNVPSGLICQPDGTCSTSLLAGIGGNSSAGEGYSDRKFCLNLSQGGNGLDEPVENAGDSRMRSIRGEPDPPDSGSAAPPQTVHYVNQVLSRVKQQAHQVREALLKVAQRDRQQQYQRYQQDQCAQMRTFLESGDPILVAEARAWFATHPYTEAWN